MGFFDKFFSKEGAVERKRAACQKKLSNMYYQKGDRLGAAEMAAQLAFDGDAASIDVLLQRFENVAPSSTIDREEKEYVHDLLVDLGDRALDGVKSYIMKTEKPVYWPLRVVEGILDDDEAYEAFFVELLESTDTDYSRNPEKKIGLVQIGGEIESEQIATCLVPFISDHNEQVRFNAAKALLASEREEIRSVLLERLYGDDEDSLRIRQLLAGGFADLGVDVSQHREALEAGALPSGFKVAKDGKIVRTP